MTAASRIAAPVLALVVGACAHAPTAEPAPQAASAPRPAPAPICPMAVPGTQVSAADTPQGEALTFTTTPDRAGALRDQVRAMADVHNARHASGGAPAGGMGGGAGGGEETRSGETGAGDGMMMPPPSRANVEEVEGGARLVITPTDPADLPRLQAAVRMHARQMQEHGCGSMGETRR